MKFRADALCTTQIARLPLTMNARVDHLIDEALALPPAERSAVVLALLDSLDGEDEAAVSQAWADEIRHRKQELRSGATRAVPWEQAKARLSAL
jgi:putative addiction module component (TIGR02574 family)